MTNKSSVAKLSPRIKYNTDAAFSAKAKRNSGLRNENNVVRNEVCFLAFRLLPIHRSGSFFGKHKIQFKRRVGVWRHHNRRRRRAWTVSKRSSPIKSRSWISNNTKTRKISINPKFNCLVPINGNIAVFHSIRCIGPDVFGTQFSGQSQTIFMWIKRVALLCNFF